MLLNSGFNHVALNADYRIAIVVTATCSSASSQAQGVSATLSAPTICSSASSQAQSKSVVIER